MIFADKDKKEFANDLKTIYHASSEENGYERMISVTEKWENNYPRLAIWISRVFGFAYDKRA